ncbi:hypothetical protein AVEN_107013-1 [Araneus ventricosus]|uniref:Uncharacterized protein n=1 Tax=Araneus ventricosus TaxID=182803 RepID=A0A4Y2RUE1_ARAVE|nr:hypothetical protein AVEN_107013-1 [Araneus ventricosus]
MDHTTRPTWKRKTWLWLADLCYDCTVICDNICNLPEVFHAADVIILNNVFECFMPKETQEQIWIWLRNNVTKPGTILVTVPTMEETLSSLQILGQRAANCFLQLRQFEIVKSPPSPSCPTTSQVVLVLPQQVSIRIGRFQSAPNTSIGKTCCEKNCFCTVRMASYIPARRRWNEGCPYYTRDRTRTGGQSVKPLVLDAKAQVGRSHVVRVYKTARGVRRLEEMHRCPCWHRPLSDVK